MKFIKSILITSTLVITSTAFAAHHNDYDANYYEDEGNLLFKLRGFYVNAPAKVKKKPTVANKEKPGKLTEHGYGFDTSTTYFFTKNLATELSLGFGLLKTKNSTLDKASDAYGDGTGSVGKKNQLFFMPLAATVQYHIAPFGAIRPYVGGGYHGSYFYTRSKSIKVKPGHGPVLQAGVDFVSKDDTFITFDVRKYFLKSKVTFKKALLSKDSTINSVDSKIDFSPLIVSLGFGFKF